MLRKCKDDLTLGMKLEPFEIVYFGLRLKRLGLYLKPDYALECNDDKEEEEWSQIHDHASREEDLYLVMIKSYRLASQTSICNLEYDDDGEEDKLLQACDDQKTKKQLENDHCKLFKKQRESARMDI
ncbi:hypothetical protein PanWU01x14_008500 [Parasponia andersonii]|uniref:Uncharacterized protein n=1 Tax=Parasponia andersonii TaxID=3476 RepID=A0A2P5E268_PARAD|nr:hypothetical protein PanWU01x14_008500 [Parasponia andersonii]